ncbi:MAG: DNA mismatch repair endonuclease MutL [Nitrospirae bacterium]|jgi:DNA mismatch repair protein MutL|nr:DNA mismatch repair endonuclease MutL [Nitrospirota bacterium]
MPQIKILPPELRNKIAAGEVIERPSSVVKELIENSIDAESTDINIDILHAGKRLIRVSDNGKGMDKDDAMLCFKRHATSKISSEKDLFNIITMGFRGEALPSIASVSKVKLITGIKDNPAGISIEIDAGEIKEIKDSQAIGTIIEVRDLFYNLPARKKFLKSNSTELLHIIDIITREALSHPKIGFKLTVDGKNTIILPSASGFKERIMQTYGEEFVNGLLEIQAGENGLSMISFVSKSNFFRNSKSHQNIFINKRPVKDSSISSAVYRAYEGILPNDKHPVFIIFLDIEPSKIDFNVHPAKREVRFENKEIIYRFIFNSIRDSIRGERIEYSRPFTELPEMTSFIKGQDVSFSGAPANPSEIISEPACIPYVPSLPFIFLGDTFIAVSGKGGLTLIDHHAAHERILYEKLLKKINLNCYQLLFPKQVVLSHKEYRVLIDNLDLLRDFGIDIDDFGHDTVIVRSLPEELEESDLRGILSDAAACLIKGTAADKSLKEEIAARIACHNSIRGRKILNQERVSQLLKELEKTEFPDQCPHGRPTRIFYSLDDLKKLFKRK